MTVEITTVALIEMDEYNKDSIIDAGKNIANGGLNDVAGIYQDVKLCSVTALPVMEAIDCLKEEDLPTV